MGRPVVHFEVVGKDGEKLQSYYADLFDWNVNAENEMKYGLVDREANSNAEGIGLGGTRVMGPETIMGRMVLGQFKDPEGNVIGLIEGGA